MLGKLIKHEWRSVWKVPALVNSFLLLYTFVGILSLHSSIWQTGNRLIESLLLLASVTYFISIIVVGFTVMIYLIVRFYKNLYTDEGYLMHTLPVSQKELILSKLCIALLWSVLTVVVIFGSIFAIIITLLSLDGYSLAEVWSDIIRMFDIAFREDFKKLFGITPVHGLLLSVLSFFLSACQSILMVYAAISIGQLFQKHKVLGSVLSYFGIAMFLQTINSFLMIPLLLDAVYKQVMSFLPYYYLGLLESAVLCIVFFFVTEYFMKKKLNLD